MKMKVERIILLDSINDKITRYRASLQNNSPLLTDYRIEHCYIANVNVPDNESEYAALDAYDLTYGDLFSRLDEKVKSFNPEMILVHLGIGFKKDPETVTKVLFDIKKKYPQLQIGSDRQTSIDVFDETEEINRLR